MDQEIEALKSVYGDRVIALTDDTSKNPVIRIKIPVLVTAKSPQMAYEAAAYSKNEDNVKIPIFCTIPCEQIEAPSINTHNGRNYWANGVVPNPFEKPDRLQRTVSGSGAVTRVEVGEVPPLELCLVFNSNYPETAPDFTLTSEWMTPIQLTGLCRQMDIMAREKGPMPLVALWVDWLENNAASEIGLNLDDGYRITEEENNSLEEIDFRSIALNESLIDRLFAFLKHEMEAVERRFRGKWHVCPVCMEERSGQDMHKLNGCRHFFCTDCLSAFVHSCLHDGTIHLIKCPETNCEGTVKVSSVRSVLGDREYERFDNLALSKALDSMQDITWCPRCETVVLKDSPQADFGRCVNCYFAFCTTCREAFHSDSNCPSLTEKLNELSREELETNGTGQNSKEQQLKEKKTKQKWDILSKICVRNISKPCPRCRVRIQKIEGCNKVTCSQCANVMCWVCGKSILGYGHFGGQNGCPTFTVDPQDEIYQILARRVEQREPPEEYVLMQEQLEQNPELRQKVSLCPQCGQKNLKQDDRNNHLRCWSCRISFCYICRTKLTSPISAHFSNRRCPHHSDH